MVLAILAVCCKSDDTVIQGSIIPDPGETRTVVASANADDPTENNLKAAIVEIYGENFAETLGLSIVIEGTINQADFASLRTFEVVDLSNVNVVGLIDVMRGTYVDGVAVDGTVEQVTGNAIPAYIFSGENDRGIIEQITLPNSVTIIGEGAFKNCTNIMLISASSVETIKANAFEGCVGLTTISGVVKENITETIGEYAFYNAGIANLVIPATVNTIGVGAFTSDDDSKYYTSIAIDGDGKLLDDGTYRLPTVVADAFPDAYDRNVGESYIQLTGGAEETKSFIPYEYCGWTLYNLMSGESTTDAVTVALDGTQTLTDVISEMEALPYSLTVTGAMTVDDSTNDFAALEGIATVDLSGATIIDDTGTAVDMTEIPAGAFMVETATVSTVKNLSSVTAVTSKASGVTRADDEGNSLISITLPSTIVTIGEAAFKNCETLLYVNFSGTSAVATFGAESFSGCKILLQTTFDSMTAVAQYMGDSAFENCDALTYVSIPTTMTKFGECLFEDCDKLETISANWFADGANDELPTVTAKAFPAAYAAADYSASNKYIVVPDYAKKSYASNGWETLGIDDGTYIGDGAEYTTPVLVAGELNTALEYLFGDGYATGDVIEKVRIQGEVQALEVQTYLQNFKEIYFVTNDFDGNVINDAGAGRTLVAATIVNGGSSYTTANSLSSATWANSGSGNLVLEVCVLPEGLTAVIGDTFNVCSNLHTVGMPSTVTSTGWRTFGSCTSLTKIFASGDATREQDWSEYIKVTGANVFQGCTALEYIKFGENLTTMVGYTLNGCTALKTVEFSETASPFTMADLTINNCTALEHIIMPWTATSTMPSIAAQSAIPSQFYAVNAGSTCYFTLPTQEDGTISADVLTSYQEKKLDSGITWAAAYNLTAEAAGNNTTQEGYLTIYYNEDATAEECTLSTVIADAITESGTFWDKIKVVGNLVMTSSLDDIDDLDAVVSFVTVDLSEANFILDGTLSTAIPASVFKSASRPSSLSFNFTDITFGYITSIGGSSFQFYSNLQNLWFSDDSKFSMPTYTFNSTSLTNDSFNKLLTHVSSFGTALSFNDSVVTEMIIPSTTTLTAGTIGANVFGSTAAATGAHSGLKAVASVKFSDSITDVSQIPTLGDHALPAQLYDSFVAYAGEAVQEKVYIDMTNETRFTASMVKAVSGWENVNFNGTGAYVAPNPQAAINGATAEEYTKGELAAEVTGLDSKTSIVVTGLIDVADLQALKGFETIDISGVSFDEEVTDALADLTFEYETQLTSVALPSVTSLPDYLFSGCTSLASVTVGGSSNFTVGAYAFEKTIVDSDQLLTILARVSAMGEGAFYEITTLAKVSLSSSLTAIPDYAFYGCSAAASINVPYAVTSIGKAAFLGCNAVERITLNWTASAEFASIVGTTAVNEASLPTQYNAGGSLYITIADTATGAESLEGWSDYYLITTSGAADLDPTLVVVTEVGTLDAAIKAKFGDDYADSVHDKIVVSGPINGVYNLGTLGTTDGVLDNDYTCLQYFKVVDLEDATSQFQNITAANVLTTTANAVPSRAFYGNTTVEEIVFPAAATNINGQACQGCTALAKVTMPTVNFGIQWSAFGNCSSLQNLTQAEHDRANSYGAGAFSGCTQFTSFTVGASIESFNLNILDNCTAMTSLTIQNTTCTTIQTGALDGCASLASISLPYSTASQLPTISNQTSTTTYTDIFPSQFQRGSSASRYLSFPNATETALEGIKATVISGDITWGTLFCFSEKDITESGGTIITGGTVSINSGVAVDFEAEQLGTYLNSLGDEYTRTTVLVTGSVIGTDWTELARFANVDLSGASFGGEVPVSAFNSATTLITLKLPEVTVLGNAAFSGCTALESLTIAGDGTYTIGSSCFQNCKVLADAELQAIIGRATYLGDYTTFSGCSTLTRLTNIRDEVTEIRATTFQNCTSLQKVIIPAQVTVLGNTGGTSSSVFTGCSALVDVMFMHSSAANIVAITNGAGSSSWVFDEVYRTTYTGTKQYIKVDNWINVSDINSNGWENYNFVTESNYAGTTIDDEDTDTGGDGSGGTTTDPDPTYVASATVNGAAASYESVADMVTALSAVTDAGTASVTIASVDTDTALDFTDMWAVLRKFKEVDLTGVNFGASVASYAFSWDTSTSDTTTANTATEIVKLPETVTALLEKSFYNCSAMTTVTVEGTHSLTLSGTVFSTSPNISDACLQEFVKRTTSYLSGYVYVSTAITEVKDIPASVTQIWPALFNKCTSLTKVTIPATVKRFGNGTSGTPTASNIFAGCTNLTEVYFQYTSADDINAVEGTTAVNANTAAVTYIFDAAFLATAEDADKKYIIVPDTVVIDSLSADWKLYNFKNVSNASTSGSGSIAGTDTDDQSDNY